MKQLYCTSVLLVIILTSILKKSLANGPSYFLALALLLLLRSATLAQRSPVSVSLTPSVRVRSTLMNAFNLGAVRQNVYIPYFYERNAQSISLGPQLQVSIPQGWSLSYTPFLRYGYAYSTVAPSVDSLFGHPIYKRTDHKKVLVDQQFCLSKALASRQRQWYVPSSIAVGWGVINSGQRYYLQNGNLANGFVRVETHSFDLAAGFGSPTQRWAYRLAGHYLYQGMANNRDDQFLCYSLTVGYRLLSHTLEPRN